MSAASVPGVILAAALAAAQAAAPGSGALAQVPAYPGGKAVHMAGSIVVTTPDPLPKVKTGYTALFRKAGWKPTAPDDVLNGDVPGAGKADMEALARAVTYLSFERQGLVADLFLAPGKDRRNRPITLVTILAGPAPDFKPTPSTDKGNSSGRP